MAYTFPIIRDYSKFKGTTTELTDSILSGIREVVKLTGMSQLTMLVGLCNALSLCFEAAIRNVKTKELEIHLERIVNLLNHLCRHPKDIPRNTL